MQTLNINAFNFEYDFESIMFMLCKIKGLIFYTMSSEGQYLYIISFHEMSELKY